MKNQRFGDQKLTLVAPSGGVTAGVPVLIGALLVIPSTTQLVGESFDGYVEGVFELTKKTGVTPAQGGKAYWDNTAGAVTTAATSGFYQIGTFTQAYLTGDVLAEVRLDGVALTVLP